jgi:epoxide hydrolase-like predicted phosphatase
VSAIEAVVSDFGGVLTTPLLRAFAVVQEEHDLDADALGGALRRIAERDGAHPLYELECGRMTERDFLKALMAQLREDLDRDVHLHSFAERYFAELQPNEAMFGFLRSLRDRGCRLALLTNNVREWEPRWRAMLPVDELFEVVVDSAFVGVRKPDAAIYRLTCDRLGVKPERCLFVDDVEANCAAAAELGMTAVLFRSNEQAIAEMRAALGDGQFSEPRRSQR